MSKNKCFAKQHVKLSTKLSTNPQKLWITLLITFFKVIHVYNIYNYKLIIFLKKVIHKNLSYKKRLKYP